MVKTDVRHECSGSNSYLATNTYTTTKPSFKQGLYNEIQSLYHCSSNEYPMGGSTTKDNTVTSNLGLDNKQLFLIVY